MMLEKLRKFGRIKPKLPKQKAHLNRVAALGCLVCHSPAEIHHVRTGNQAKDDRFVVPLCALHHRHGNDSFHQLGSSDAFWKAHGVDLPREADWQYNVSVNEGLIR